MEEEIISVLGNPDDVDDYGDSWYLDENVVLKVFYNEEQNFV